MEYSRRKLSWQSDKLIAFNGIMKHFTSLLSSGGNDGYAAGLWKVDFLPGLLWYDENPQPCRQDINGCRVPSWSWLSQDGEISYSSHAYSSERRHGDNLARLEELSVDLCMHNATDNPGDSHVTIFGVLRSAVIRRSTALSATEISYIVLFDGHVALSCGDFKQGTNRAKITLDVTDTAELGTCSFLPLIFLRIRIDEGKS